jgi:ribonuclease P protein component
VLPFKNRLTKRRDFEKVQKMGQFFSSQNIALKVMENGLNDSRIGFGVGLKFSKKAVERNLAKRRLREIAKNFLKKIKPGFDIVVFLRRREGEKMDYRKLNGMTEEALIKSQLIKPNK